MALRNTLLCTGLLGLLGIQEVQAQDTEYGDLSRGELNKLVQKKSVVLNDSNFKKEVLDYDGAAIILFDSTCNVTEHADTIDRNMEIVYLRLIDTFDEAKVNKFPLKFAYMDGCKFNGNNAQTYIGLHVTTTETHMYLDGKEIDRRLGGPLDASKISNSITACTAWVDSNLLGKPYIKEGQKMRVAYNGATHANLEPYKQN